MSRWLDPKLRYEKVPFGKKMKRVFGVVEEVDPHVSFNVTASVPTVLTTTSTIPIPFTITFDPGRSETPEVPRVELVSVHARLTMYSAYRVSRYSLLLSSMLLHL